MTDKPLKILLVEDNEGDRLLIKEALADTSLPLEVREAKDGSTALVLFEEETPDCILLDYHLPDIEAELLLQHFQQNGTAAVIVLTGNNDEALAYQLMTVGAFDYLMKDDLTPQMLYRTFRYATARSKFMLAEQEHKRQLEAKNLQLRDLYQTAHQFVENVSHEFRTPMTVIKEYASIIRDGLAGEVNEEQDQFLGVIVDRIEDLSIMVNDMLDISRIEAGLLRVSRHENRVENIIEHFRPALERRARSSGCDLEVVIEDGLLPVYCDGEKVGRVLINLVSNAFKFGHEGGRVTLRASRKQDDREVILSVTDEGPGIPENQLKNIFERFRQLDNSVRVSTKGFGLGLNIVKELVYLNMGEMFVHSELGGGSTFSFTVPEFDSSSLMSRYLNGLVTMRDGGEFVSLIELDVPADVAAETREEIEELLQLNIRRSDLLFRRGDSSWLLLLACQRPEVREFLNRLEKLWFDENRNRPNGALPILDPTIRGSWHIKDQKQCVIESFAQEFLAVDRPPAIRQVVETIAAPALDTDMGTLSNNTEASAKQHRWGDQDAR